MSEENEKHESHEHHEHKEAKTITVKKDTLWMAAVFVLLAALVISMFTGGFGIGKGNVTGNAAAGNTAGASSGSGSTAVDTSAFTSDSSLFPSLGPSDAKYTVVEFADFQCPYCALAAGLSNESKQYASQVPYFGIATQLEDLANQGKIRFIFVAMNFLDSTNRGGTTKESTWAAEAAYCANDQGKFWQMHDAIYAANDMSEDDGKYTKANLEKIAAGISGLDTSKFNACLENDTFLSNVQQSEQAASTVVSGTPEFVVNGQQVQASTTAIMSAIGQ